MGSTPVASALVGQSLPDADKARGRGRFLAIFSVPSPVLGREGTHEGRDLPLGACGGGVGPVTQDGPCRRASAGRGVGGQPPGRTGGNQPPAGPSDALPKALKAPGSCLWVPAAPQLWSHVPAAPQGQFTAGEDPRGLYMDYASRDLLQSPLGRFHGTQSQPGRHSDASNCSVPGYRSWREPLKAFRFSTKGGPGRLSPGRDFPLPQTHFSEAGHEEGGSVAELSPPVGASALSHGLLPLSRA